MNNPLMSGRPPAQADAPHPMLRHAQLWQHVNGLDTDTLQAHVARADVLLPIVGALAGNPNVKAKDVIKAVSSAVADGHMEPSMAVSVISDMPADPGKLRPWLRERYGDNLSKTVHAKAALLRQAQPQPQPQPDAPPPGAAPMAAPGPMPGGQVQ